MQRGRCYVKSVLAEPFLPLLLVAAILERHVKRPNTLQRSAADRHVGSPGKARGSVLRAEVQCRDGRLLAPATMGRRAFQAREDRPGEDLSLGMFASGCEQRVEPALANLHVVVDEHDQLACRALDPGVAGNVEAERPVMWLIASAEALGKRASFLRGPGVVHDDRLDPGLVRLRRDRAQRDPEVVETRTRGHDDRGRGWVETGGSDPNSLGLGRRWFSSCTTAIAEQAVRSAWWTTS